MGGEGPERALNALGRLGQHRRGVGCGVWLVEERQPANREPAVGDDALETCARETVLNALDPCTCNY